MPKRTKKLRIAFVVDDGMESEDGVQQYIKTVGEWMRGLGHDVHYLCGETSRTDIPGVYPLAKNLKVKFNGNSLSIPLPVSMKRIKKHLADNSYDVIHVQIPHSPLFGAKLVRAAYGTSVIVSTFHILPYGMVAKYGTRLLGLWLHRNLRLFDVHISNSSASQQFSRWAFGTKSIIIPNMVDLKLFKPKNALPRSKEYKQVVFVGRLVDRKGCRYLIEALAEVHAKHPDYPFRLDICGKGPKRPELEALVKDLDLERMVTFEGFVSTEEKIQWLQSADVAVFPSYSGESFGIVLIEAMAAGSGVVIGGNNPGYTSVLGQIPESLVDVKDVSEFASKLARFLDPHYISTDIHNRQQALVRQYDVEVVGRQLLDTYNDCKKTTSQR